MVDARDSKSRGGDTVSVRVRPSAPVILCRNDWLPPVNSLTSLFIIKKDNFMNPAGCIFCKIIKKEIPSKIIFENDYVLVVEDVDPKAPVHYLILPKKHVVNLLHVEESDSSLVWEMIKVIKQLAENLEDPKAFNIISNNGKEAGQSVFHMHWHFMSGKNIYESEIKL